VRAHRSPAVLVHCRLQSGKYGNKGDHRWSVGLLWSPVHDRKAAAIPLSQSLNPSCFRASNDFEFSELGVEGVPADAEGFGHAGDVPLEMDVRPADGFFLHPLEIKGG